MSLSGAMRLVPACCALWLIALLAVHGRLAPGAAMGVVIGAGLLILLAAALLARTRATHLEGLGRGALAHTGLVLLCALIQTPALHSAAADTTALVEAARTGAVIDLTVEAVTAPAAPGEDAPVWAREQQRMRARVIAGSPARIGRHRVRLRSHGELLLQLPPPQHRELAATTPGAERTASHGNQIRPGAVLRAYGSVQDADGLLILTADRLEVIDAGSSWRGAIQERARTASDHLPGDVSALVRGMTTGDTRGLSEHTEEIMQRAGISHLVAVSGANILLVLGAVLLPLLAAGVRRRPRILAAAAVGAGYVALVGEEPSVMRAAAMAAPVLLARFLGRPLPAVNALLAAVGAWSVLDPLTATQLGFVLSALATAAILLVAPPLARGLAETSGGRIPAPIWLVITVPLAAQLAVTPVLILITPEVSLWAVGVNILVAPLVGPTTILAMLATALALAHLGLGTTLFSVAGGGAHGILLIARTAEHLPGSRITVPDGAPGALLAVLVLLAAAAAWMLRRRSITRWALAAVLVALLAPPAVRHMPLPAGHDWRIAACDVGQGDAVLLRDDSARSTILIDTGPDPAALTRCLDHLAVQRIDLLVLTHPHADHTGGIAALHGERAPHAQWICPLPEARESIAAGGTPRAVTAQGPAPAPGADPRSPGLTLQVLWPVDAASIHRVAALEDSSGESSALNDCSIVLAATWPDGTRYVGLGDLEPAGQEALRAFGPGSADVVKMAHHGSARQEPALYRELNPGLALISVGADNSFGHPTDRALGMLAQLGAEVRRTDRAGDLLVTAPVAAGRGGVSEPADRVASAPGRALSARSGPRPPARRRHP